MKTDSLSALSVRITKDQLTKILSILCQKTFVKYKLESAFEFTESYWPDVMRSGDHPDGKRGIQCFLEFKELSADEDAPYLGQGTTDKKFIHFSQKEIDNELIEFATKQKHLPQGVNVNRKCRVQWLPHEQDAEVEVVIDFSFDDPSDFQ